MPVASKPATYATPHEDSSPCSHERGPSLGVHLLAGLPTEAVCRGFERAREMLPMVPLDVPTDAVASETTRIGVPLPPFVEPSLVVESWEDCDFLEHRFGRPAYIAGVSTFIDVEQVGHHMASTGSLSSRGWGRGDRDGRTVADIVVGQIESATHLVLVGGAPVPEVLARGLGVLNPGAPRIPCHDGSNLDPTALAVGLGLERPGTPRCETPPARSIRVAPPWLEVLRGEVEETSRSDLFVYRRSRPFEPTRLRHWLENPPREVLRGKGHVWLAGAPDHSFGYSCAGSVHRLFPGGRWWASHGEGVWPSCRTQRRRLLERWHPRFGDRRQELVFVGVDLDAAGVSAGLDACLVSEASLDCALDAERAPGPGTGSTPRARIH